MTPCYVKDDSIYKYKKALNDSNSAITAINDWRVHRILINEKKFNKMLDVIKRGF